MNPKRKMIKKQPGEPGYHPSDNLCWCKWCGKQKKPDEMEWECRKAIGKCIKCFEKGVTVPYDSRHNSHSSRKRSNSGGGSDGSIHAAGGMLVNNNSQP